MNQPIAGREIFAGAIGNIVVFPNVVGVERKECCHEADEREDDDRRTPE